MDFCDYILVSAVSIGALGFPFLLGFLAGYNICAIGNTNVTNYYLCSTHSDEETSGDESSEEEKDTEEYSSDWDENEQYSEDEVENSDEVTDTDSEEYESSDQETPRSNYINDLFGSIMESKKSGNPRKLGNPIAQGEGSISSSSDTDSDEEKEKAQQRRERILASKVFNKEFIEQVEAFNKEVNDLFKGPGSLEIKLRKMMDITKQLGHEEAEKEILPLPDIVKITSDLQNSPGAAKIKSLLSGSVASKEDADKRYKEFMSILGDLPSFQGESFKKSLEECKGLFEYNFNKYLRNGTFV